MYLGCLSSHNKSMTTTQPGTEQFSPSFEQMWAQRPLRLPKGIYGDAKIAGVCEGISARYQVDVTLVRIYFLLAAFFGGGVLAYLIAWLIMRRPDCQLSPIEAAIKPGGGHAPAEQRLGWWLLVAVLVLGLGTVGTSLIALIGSSTFITFAVTFGVWYLLHKRAPIA